MLYVTWCVLHVNILLHIAGRIKELLEPEVGIPKSKQHLGGWVNKNDQRIQDDVSSCCLIQDSTKYVQAGKSHKPPQKNNDKLPQTDKASDRSPQIDKSSDKSPQTDKTSDNSP